MNVQRDKHKVIIVSSVAWVVALQVRVFYNWTKTQVREDQQKVPQSQLVAQNLDINPR